MSSFQSIGPYLNVQDSADSGRETVDELGSMYCNHKVGEATSSLSATCKTTEVPISAHSPMSTNSAEDFGGTLTRSTEALESVDNFPVSKARDVKKSYACAPECIRLSETVGHPRKTNKVAEKNLEPQEPHVEAQPNVDPDERLPQCTLADNINHQHISRNVRNPALRYPSMDINDLGIAGSDSVNDVLTREHSLMIPSNVSPSYRDLCNDTSTSREDDNDNSAPPWGETDAGFLFLFLWETQEQECKEAMQRWSIDPVLYRFFIVQDMSVLVDRDKRARCGDSRWRERLKQYLMQNFMQLGCGFPGITASAAFPASLGEYMDMIAKFQRILKSMEVEEFNDQKLSHVSSAILHSLPTTIIGLSSKDSGEMCVICKEEWKLSTMASQLPCMHVYHWDCIISWLIQNNNCPICRLELPTDDYDHELQRKIHILRESRLLMSC
ncbi:hypothetical protein KP509_37G068700 [Ceratopteris richardii]|nr:hypothetical protein KP509_37G068700 [Ceratopteris richardii]